MESNIRALFGAVPGGTGGTDCSACAKLEEDKRLLSNALSTAIWYIRESHAKGWLSGGGPLMKDLEAIHMKNGTGEGI